MKGPRYGHRLMMVTITRKTERAAVLRQEEREPGKRAPRVWNEAVRRFSRNARSLLREFYPGTPTETDFGKMRTGSGGVGVIELGSNHNWHMHALVWGPYVPQKELSERWAKKSVVLVCKTCGYEADPPRQGRRGTAGKRGHVEDRRGIRTCQTKSCPKHAAPLEISRSTVVDIREVRSPKKAVAYVLKYILKPTSVERPQTHSLVEWSLQGSRRVFSWGALYNVPAPPREKGFGFTCITCRSELRPDEVAVRVFGWVIPIEELIRPPPGRERYATLEEIGRGEFFGGFVDL